MNIAQQRLLREFKELASDEGIGNDQYYIESSEENMLNLKGYVTGPPDTPYEGGRFYLEMTIAKEYPFAPPKVKFITRIWHPNISSATGAICLDILKDQWAAAMTIRTVLLSLQTLLAVPEANDPQDAVVAKQYIENIELFESTARYWVYIFALPCQSIDTKSRFRITPSISKFPTARPDLPITKFIEFNMKVRKLVEIMQTDELTALHNLSSHNWDVDRAVGFLAK